MQCEMCGAEIRGAPNVIYVEGAELQVCSRCSRHGTPVQTGERAPAKRGVQPVAVRAKRRPRDVFDLMEGEIVDDYNEVIRHAREARGWSQKDLAGKIKEKEMLIKKIEKADLIPEDAVRKKLENALEIKLLDAAFEESAAEGAAKVTTTLGDLIKVKRSR